MNVDELRKQVIDSIVWTTINPNNSGRNGSSKKDILISIQRASRDKYHKKEGFAITFRNGSEEKIAPSGRVAIGELKDKLYFKDDPVAGYKISVGRTGNPTVKIHAYPDSHVAFVGNYDLMYDDTLEMYYIRKETEDETL